MALAFLKDLGAAALSSTELAGIGNGKFISGCKLKVGFDAGYEYLFAVALPRGFPYEAPRVAVLDAPPVLSWPHLEEGKLLCVLPPGTSVDPDAPVEQVRELLNNAVRLVQDILAGRCDSDFDREFTAYWRRGASTDVRCFMSLLVPRGTHRAVCIWRGKSFHIVAEKAHDLLNWVANRYDKEESAGMTIAKSLCLVAEFGIRPVDYPRTGSDLRRLFADDDQALELLSKQACGEGLRDIVLAVPTPTGMGFGAISIDQIDHARHDRKLGGKFWNGFRKGHMPRDIAVLRATSAATKVMRHKVERTDHSWVHGRDHDSRQEVLKEAKVIVVGCGSLGSSVAELLARSGVGRLTLVDGEVVTWSNISRHALGAGHIDKYKASALARHLTAAFPHLTSVEAIDRPLTLATSDRLAGHDLVVTTTGAWSVDSLVNSCQRNGETGQVLYSWLEPHAAAAHAVTIPPTGACLRCHMACTGAPELTVSQWDDGGVIAVPSCGGTFVPYGAVDLAFAHALVAGQALDALLAPSADSRHAIWIGRTATWYGLGGRLNPAWRKEMNDPGEGGMLVVRPWMRVPVCPCCGTPL